MLKTLKSIQNEYVVNIKELQKSPSRHLRGITRILRGKDTLGFFLSKDQFDVLIHDLELISDPVYLKKLLKQVRTKKTIKR
ncbi:MAG: hypothetical protein ABH832_00985 [bacterium]